MSSLDPKQEGWIPVEGHEHKYRDPISNAIINTNVDEYAKYMKAYNSRRNKAEDFDTLQKEVSDLKSDISDMKTLLKQLVEEKHAS
tara:strand:- start:2631 stop:2888 length:258 start_codon:yes stop_codon:yes gene_type:complete